VQLKSSVLLPAACLISGTAFLSAQAVPPPQPEAQSISEQKSPTDDPERQHAIDLFNSGKFVEAMPLFEKLAVDYDKDSVIKEGWAFSMMAYATTLTDAGLRKKARSRARALALQAQKLGDNSAMVQLLLQIPEDGSEPTFSHRRDVDDAMKAAEADFARGDLEKAREGYLHALLLEPNDYEAALFIGDTYFKQKTYGSSGEWFARAIQIDPNRETAYRYWGDALWAMGKSADAREKYINAIIAEPYTQVSWTGLNQWSQRTKVPLNWVRLQDKGRFVSTSAGTRLTLDPNFHTEDPMFKPWLIYYGQRLEWQKKKFKEQFPNEPQYRRTASEEADSLRLMVVALRQPNILTSEIDPSLAMLMKVNDAGFLSPFALLNRADKEIAKDYIPYRDAHRELVYRYFDEFVVPKAPQ
jgi:tetratricopeptide (TPR) repeat protein